MIQDLECSYPKTATRGRWAEDKSMRGYANPHLVGKNESLLSPEQIALGNAIWGDPAANSCFMALPSEGAFPNLGPVG